MCSMMKYKSRRSPNKVKQLDPRELDRLVGELAWAKERGYDFRELEQEVTAAVLRRDMLRGRRRE